MATIKAYTDLSQSKKLAEILPIESADMWWDTSEDKPRLEKHYHEYLSRTIDPIPTWSLSALIELIPDKISINNESYYLSFTKKSVEFRGPITWDGQKAKSFEMDNILDAAFEMVCWLKENGKI